MTFAQSPYPDVVNKGLRIDTIRDELNLVGWDMTVLDTALKALTDDNGNVVLPNGVTELNADMRAKFERLPQVMQQAHSLYEVEYKKMAPVEPAAPPQTVTFEFQAVNSNASGDTAGPHNVPVQMVTSDGLPLVAASVSVEVTDVGTGTASTPGDYTFAGDPQQLTWNAGDASGLTKNAVVTIAGVNGPTETVDLELQNPVGGAEGAQDAHEVTIVNIGA